jgi:DNA-binding transcriptional ArsR family regulator
MTYISTNTKIYYIEKPDQLELLVSPVRQDILDSLESMGPSSVFELSRAIGLSADALYYHMKKLVAVGLILEHSTRPSDRRDESIFALPARTMRLRYDPANSAQTQSVSKIVNSMLRSAGRDFQTGMDNDAAVTNGPCRNLWGARLKGWLSQNQISEVNDLLHQLYDVFHASGPSDDKTLCALTWNITPIDAQPVRRQSKDQAPQTKRAT